MNILIDTIASDISLDLDQIHFFVATLLQISGEDETEISISFVSDTKIQELNREYRGKDATTDVLSFSMREGEMVGQSYILGDIIVSLDTAKKQAQEEGIIFKNEIYELLFHGFLHLLGFDHQNETLDQWQKAEEDLIQNLKQLNKTYIPKGMVKYSITDRIEFDRI